MREEAVSQPTLAPPVQATASPEQARTGADWFWLVGSLLVLSAAWLLQFEPPDRIVVPGLNLPLPDTCWSRSWLGLPCPGCGLTRSFVLAAHGAWGQAFALHPPGTLLFVAVLLQAPLRLLSLLLPSHSFLRRTLIDRCLQARPWLLLVTGLFLLSLAWWLWRIF